MDNKKTFDFGDFSRRGVLGAGASVAALGAGLGVTSEAAAMGTRMGPDFKVPTSSKTAPFDSLRDFVEAMDDLGLLVRFDRVDQDAYEGTAIMYRMIEQFGIYGAPVVSFENVKVNGEWIKGPLLANVQSNYHVESIVWGLEPDYLNPHNSYRNARTYMVDMLEKNGGGYPQIAPTTVAREDAPCKEIVLEGDEIDLEKFAFIQGNPGDAGRYINTGSTYTFDPDEGQNFGTYRCQIKGPRTIGLNSEPNQTGHRHIRNAMARGEKTMKIAITLGQDPVTWVVSGSRVTPRGGPPVDEHAIVGGLRGKSLEVVKADLSDLMIPAYSEMVIEGDVDLTQMAPEGPYHETYGYLGTYNEERFLFNVERITHRKNPVLMNSFTSIGGGFVKAPYDATTHLRWTKEFPQIQEIYYRDDYKGIYFVSIKKDKAGRGMEIAKAVSEGSFIAKVVVVVDDDMNIMDSHDMFLAMGSRWQPVPATEMYPRKRASFFEPSAVNGFTSKIAIDATMQWPGEGGPQEFPALNKNLFLDAAPDAMDAVLRKWPDKILRGPYI